MKSPSPCIQRVIRFFPYRVYTDSNRHDTLGYEWPLARYCHLVVFDIMMVGSSGLLLYI
jgi:hypothetical protein